MLIGTALLATTALSTDALTTAIGSTALLGGSLWALVQSSNAILNNVEAFAERKHISGLMVGVGLGILHSVPEFAVAVTSAVSGAKELAIGNLVGANVAHVFLILGAVAAIGGVKSGAGNTWKFNMLSMGGATIGFAALLATGTLTPVMGFGMAGLGLGYMAANLILNKREADKHKHGHHHEHDDHDHSHHHHDHGHSHGHHCSHGAPGAKNTLSNIFWSVAGMGALIYSADLVVESASNVARFGGISEAVIGTLAVAFGTALPELTNNVKAALRGNTDLAVGNILSCNIFNILAVGGVLGFAGTQVPDSFTLNSAEGIFNLAALGTSAGLMTTTLTSGKGNIKKWQGYAAMAIYAGYVGTSLYFGTDNKEREHISMPPISEIYIPA